MLTRSIAWASLAALSASPSPAWEGPAARVRPRSNQALGLFHSQRGARASAAETMSCARCPASAVEGQWGPAGPGQSLLVGRAATCTAATAAVGIGAGLSDEDISKPCGDTRRTRVFVPSTACGLEPYTFDNVPDMVSSYSDLGSPLHAYARVSPVTYKWVAFQVEILSARNGHRAIR